MRVDRLSRLFVSVAALFLCVNVALADGRHEHYPGRASAKSSLSHRQLSPTSASLQSATVSELTLLGGSTLSLVSPKLWATLAAELSIYLRETHDEYAKLIVDLPPFNTTVRLIESREFYRETGAPEWTNAMYYRGEISIPMELGAPIDYDNIYRSVRHEYTHAILNAASGGRCPGWLDEGLAQLAEGTPNPALEPALRRWLIKNPPVPLSVLQGGFTKLQTSMVPAAYAQSLYSSKSMIESFGWKRISYYLSLLREGRDKPTAFERAFNVSERGFETAMGSHLSKWAQLAGWN